jgi:hypothetical protein
VRPEEASPASDDRPGCHSDSIRRG